MRTGEKEMIISRSPFFIPCDRGHYDNVPVRVKSLTVNLDRPAHRERSVVIRTSDL